MGYANNGFGHGRPKGRREGNNDFIFVCSGFCFPDLFELKGRNTLILFQCQFRADGLPYIL